MKMSGNDDELGYRFKFCGIPTYVWIWMLSFFFDQNWIEIDDILLNFFETFASVWDCRVQITVYAEPCYDQRQKTALLCIMSSKLRNWLNIHCTDDRIEDFLSCFWKMISVSDPNPVLLEIILSVSKNYKTVYCDAQHIFCAVPILPC